jgi:phosphatidylserine/phosphatidylglycerophosphate/cardiolipin synthase-like enzyme
MHHKFAIFDEGVVLTGSYNWTRGAAMSNEENLILSNDRRLLTAFRGEFERLWKKFEGNRL